MQSGERSEMERDSMLAHGMSKFLKERMFDTADAYSTYVCDQCGLFARRRLRKDNNRYATKQDIYYCASCKYSSRVSKIMIPYACKLLFQELMSMNIAPRIRTNKNIYTTINME
jgi:DNA-directed RNA polymerase II subunit RPB2